MAVDRRINYVGRLVVALHRRYCLPDLIPVIWAAVIACGVCEVILVLLARP